MGKWSLSKTNAAAAGSDNFELLVPPTVCMLVLLKDLLVACDELRMVLVDELLRGLERLRADDRLAAAQGAPAHAAEVPGASPTRRGRAQAPRPGQSRGARGGQTGRRPPSKGACGQRHTRARAAAPVRSAILTRHPCASGPTAFWTGPFWNIPAIPSSTTPTLWSLVVRVPSMAWALAGR